MKLLLIALLFLGSKDIIAECPTELNIDKNVESQINEGVKIAKKVTNKEPRLMELSLSDDQKYLIIKIRGRHGDIELKGSLEGLSIKANMTIEDLMKLMTVVNFENNGKELNLLANYSINKIKLPNGTIIKIGGSGSANISFNQSNINSSQNFKIEFETKKTNISLESILSTKYLNLFN